LRAKPRAGCPPTESKLAARRPRERVQGSSTGSAAPRRSDRGK
jgi:hypothetical protein